MAVGLSRLMFLKCGVCVCVYRILEQLRKFQASVLHPDYSSPFHSFEDTLYRLLPYHVYQGMAPSPQDYCKGNPPIPVYSISSERMNSC